MVFVQGDLQVAQPLQHQSAMGRAYPAQGVPVTYVPGSGEASSSTASGFVALGALGRMAIEHERARTQKAEDNARRDAVIMTQQSEINCS